MEPMIRSTRFTVEFGFTIMRFALLLLLLVYGSATMPAAADESFGCSGGVCLDRCPSRSGDRARDCRNLLRQGPRMDQNSVPVQPRSRSKYQPVPQVGRSQQPGPYVNQR